MKLGSKYDLLYIRILKYKQIYWVKKKSASNFFMHIFIMAVIYLQSVEDLKWKL